jgi:hypothetical protein
MIKKLELNIKGDNKKQPGKELVTEETLYKTLNSLVDAINITVDSINAELQELRNNQDAKK